LKPKLQNMTQIVW